MKKLALFFFFVTVVYSQSSTVHGQTPHLPVINGVATFLRKPSYPEEARKYCSDGKVEVEVFIGDNGQVTDANAISGDEMLRKSAVDAAKLTTFRQIADGPPTNLHGIIVYNFDSLAKCVKTGIVNKKALSIPKPLVENIIQPKHLRINEDKTVTVAIVVDETGTVISAKAVSGHPLLFSACEHSAMGAKFHPTLIDPGPIKVKATLTYTFKPNGKIIF